jgi:hypothetical protein
MKWTSGSTKPQCDRALPRPPRARAARSRARGPRPGVGVEFPPSCNTLKSLSRRPACLFCIENHWCNIQGGVRE